MPLETANFISQLDVNNPDNLTDYVSQGDDHLRLIKTTLTQTLPNFSAAVTYSSAELNDLRTNMTHTGTTFTFNSNTLSAIVSKDDDTAVEPRLYNDNRYVRPSVAVATNLFLNNAAPLNTKDFAGVTRNLISQSAADVVTIGTTNASAINLVNANVQVNGTHIIDLIYPVGTVYENGSVSTNPGTLFGWGTWVKHGEGRVTICQRATGTVPYSYTTVGYTAGAEEFTLSSSNNGAHTHNLSVGTIDPSSLGAYSGIGYYNGKALNAIQVTAASNGAGSSKAHVSPYIVVYRWIRTA